MTEQKPKKEEKPISNIEVICRFDMTPYERHHRRKEEIGLDFMPAFYADNGVTKMRKKTTSRGAAKGITTIGIGKDYVLSVHLEDDTQKRMVSVKVEYAGPILGKDIANTLVNVINGYYSADISVRKETKRG